MRVAALRTGAGIPPQGFAGAVEAIHARACLIGLTEGGLITLVTPETGNLPFGITLQAEQGFSFEGGAVVGAGVAVRGGVLRIQGGRFSVDLRESRPWRSNLGALGLDLDRAPVARAWEVAWSALRASGRDAAIATIAGPAILQICKAARRLDPASARNAMSRLVGLGPGSTPAGDDYLVGHLAGLWSCARAAGSRQRFIAAAGDDLRELASRTSRVSRVYLEAAAVGEVSGRLGDLAAAIAEGADAASVGAAVAAALAVGYSSGACGVLGLLLGCAAWAAADGRRHDAARAHLEGRA